MKDNWWSLDELGVYVEESHILTTCALKAQPGPWTNTINSALCVVLTLPFCSGGMLLLNVGFREAQQHLCCCGTADDEGRTVHCCVNHERLHSAASVQTTECVVTRAIQEDRTTADRKLGWISPHLCGCFFVNVSGIREQHLTRVSFLVCIIILLFKKKKKTHHPTIKNKNALV